VVNLTSGAGDSSENHHTLLGKLSEEDMKVFRERLQARRLAALRGKLEGRTSLEQSQATPTGSLAAFDSEVQHSQHQFLATSSVGKQEDGDVALTKKGDDWLGSVSSGISSFFHHFKKDSKAPESSPSLSAPQPEPTRRRQDSEETRKRVEEEARDSISISDTFQKLVKDDGHPH